MAINLDDMTLEELRELRANVERTISGFKERKRREAIAAAEEAARKHGFGSLSELTGSRRGRTTASKAGKTATRAAGDARYANPDDPAQTWTGRGRRPGWFREALDAGRMPDDMAV